MVQENVGVQHDDGSWSLRQSLVELIKPVGQLLEPDRLLHDFAVDKPAHYWVGSLDDLPVSGAPEVTDDAGTHEDVQKLPLGRVDPVEVAVLLRMSRVPLGLTPAQLRLLTDSSSPV